MAGHSSRGGTWFTEELLQTFERMIADQNCDLKHCVFELWDANDGSLLAVTAGYGVGRAFHDYSMCTLRRDHRSAGAVLTRTVAHVLKSCGYTIWCMALLLVLLRALLHCCVCVSCLCGFFLK